MPAGDGSRTGLRDLASTRRRTVAVSPHRGPIELVPLGRFPQRATAVLLALFAMMMIPCARATSSKVAASGNVSPGDVITWTITFHNDLPGTAGVEITDDVPDPADGKPTSPFVCGTDVLAQPPGTGCSYTGDIVTWTNLVLSRNATASITFVTRVDLSAPLGTRICNVAQVEFNAGSLQTTDVAGPACVVVGGFPEDCDNGVDDDLDNAADCADIDCRNDPACPRDICDNGLDDDSDGMIDCLDPDCIGFPGCQESSCTNGVDDDGDGATDCCDGDCGLAFNCSQELNCTNGLDDDCDGVADCDDTDDCYGAQCIPEDCDNGRDDNANGFADCQDDACLTDPACVGVENCGNGVDDDGDGLVDCADPGCNGIGQCRERDCVNRLDDDSDGDLDCCDSDCAGGAACLQEWRCADGFDDDCDAMTDCDDDECFGLRECLPEICTNGIDDNLDGRTDCQDPQCAGDPSCASVENCVNAVDDDGDGDVDCADAGCATDPVCLPESACGDALDNDRDGLFDCADPDCRGVPPCPASELVCDDGADDDFDGDVDCADSDCATDPSCGGTGPEADCANGLDDDADGATDCADSDCDAAPPCSPESACGNGLDDDADGAIDCADPDCAGVPPCTTESSCDNAVDDDSDGDTDCADSECLFDAACDLFDYDGDGTLNGVDCRRDDAAVWSSPVEVLPFMTVTKPAGTSDSLLEWPSLAFTCGPSTRYDVVSGEIGRLLPDDGVGGASCIDDDVALTSTTDPRPPLGVMRDGWWYLVRGQNACGDGIYGMDSLGRTRDPGLGGCP